MSMPSHVLAALAWTIFFAVACSVAFGYALAVLSWPLVRARIQLSIRAVRRLRNRRAARSSAGR